MKKINWNAVEAVEVGSFARPTAGGYVMNIASVEDVPDREYLLIKLDIAEGDFAGIGRDTKTRTGKDWGYFRLYRSYKDTALGMFKGFLVALEESNPDFQVATWDHDEQKLERLLIGAVLAEEEYENQQGEIKTALRVHSVMPAGKIRGGEFKVPPLKKLEKKTRQDPLPPEGNPAPELTLKPSEYPF